MKNNNLEVILPAAILAGPGRAKIQLELTGLAGDALIHGGRLNVVCRVSCQT
ncbi:MAG: hypothetical protein KJN61_09135 [Gammaproteobacteria bacterium]|nr:hypothetical protein [Gammaproteobacteria bacterium]NNK99435.1 hypothetical protein [Xanthomonadales bacterium]